MRPKALLVFTVQQLAACRGITRMRAVGDETHIYRHSHTRKILATSCDEFWIESGGTLSADGMFDLPIAFSPRDISTIKVNKRQMYRRRYAMLAGFADQIRAQLSQHNPRVEDSAGAGAHAHGSDEALVRVARNADSVVGALVETAS